jgi:hypothetical protein
MYQSLSCGRISKPAAPGTVVLTDHSSLGTAWGKLQRHRSIDALISDAGSFELKISEKEEEGAGYVR